MCAQYKFKKIRNCHGRSHLVFKVYNFAFSMVFHMAVIWTHKNAHAHTHNIYSIFGSKYFLNVSAKKIRQAKLHVVIKTISCLWVCVCLHIGWLHVNNIEIHLDNERCTYLILAVQLIFFFKYIGVLFDNQQHQQFTSFWVKNWTLEVILSRIWAQIIQNSDHFINFRSLFFLDIQKAAAEMA